MSQQTLSRVEDDRLVDLGAADVGELLATPGWAGRAAQGSTPVDETRGASFAPVVPRPGKIVCVGLNYRNHILEMGRELPDHPTLFAEYTETLVGATDDIVLPPETSAFDWECELAVVVGETVRRADAAAAERAIAGFAVLNDVTCRDWQNRTSGRATSSPRAPRAGSDTPARPRATCTTDSSWSPRSPGSAGA